MISEETGSISVAHNGRMVRHLDESRLRSILQRLYRPYTSQFDLGSWLHDHRREEADQAGVKELRG